MIETPAAAERLLGTHPGTSAAKADSGCCCNYGIAEAMP
jgi:hypothetical protein